MKLKSGLESLISLIDMAVEMDDESIADEILLEKQELENEYESQKIDILLSGEYDHSNAIVSIHPGAGGTEAQDWASMLYRMYTRYAERHKFKVKVLDYLDGDEAGLKSVSFLVQGENAYGYLQGENGVHRLVRVSPFNAQGKRQTSFASVEVMPEFNDEIKIDIKDEDYAIWYRDLSEDMDKYVGKTVKFRGIVAHDNSFPKYTIVVGRHVMVCCEDDITYRGLVCKGVVVGGLKKRDWIIVTAKITKEYHEMYEETGPVLYATEVKKCNPPEQQVATFY